MPPIAALLLAVHSTSEWPREIAPPTGGFGHRLLTLPDVDEDGVPELAIGSPGDLVVGAGAGRLFIVSGKTAALLSQRPLNMLVRGQLPLDCDCESLDLDGDSVGERFVPLDPDTDGPLVAYSGRTWKPVIWMHHDDPGHYVEDFGASVAPAGDLDLDGLVDVAVGCSEYGFDSGDAYAVEIFSGRDGHLLLAIDTAGKSVTVARAADFNGDENLDLPIGLPEDNLVHVLDGNTLRSRLGSNRRVGIAGTVLLTVRRASFPSGTAADPFPALPPASGGR